MSTPASHRLRRIGTAAVALGASLTLAPTALGGGEAPPPKTPPPTCIPILQKDCSVDVAIAKYADAETYAPGDVVGYTITVTNTGQAPVWRGRIVVSDPSLPDLAPNGPATGWLLPGDSTTWQGTRAVTAADCGPLINTATVSLAPWKGGGSDVNAGNDTASRTVTVGGAACMPAPPPPVVTPPASVAPVTPPAAPAVAPAVTTTGAVCVRPRLTARIAGTSRPRAGRVVTYRVRVRATRAAATRLTLRVTLPTGFSLPRAVAGGRLHRGTLVVRSRTLRAGHTRVLTLRLRPDRTAVGRRAIAVSVTAGCGATVRSARVVHTAAALPARVSPAVTG
jgi:uncharacterized repeat protein (TIGR01451 family)